MKQCLACKTIYTDATLRYCLSDGSFLGDVIDEESTVFRKAAQLSEKTAVLAGDGQIRVGIPAEGSPQIPSATSEPSPQGSANGIFKVVIKVVIKVVMVLIGLGIFTVIAAGVGVLVYFNLNKSEPTANVSGNVSGNEVRKTPSPTPVREERDELRDQIANLERQLSEQKKSKQPANSPLTIPKQSVTTTTARANSPGDGFLALRSLPNSEAGDRIAKIPHGATVTIGACGPVIKPVSKSGRWCQASYNGLSGWVFDAFLSF